MLRRHFPATLIVLTAAAIAAAGCSPATTDDSSDEFKGDQQQAAKVIEELEEQASKQGGRGAKDVCTKLITDQLARKIAAQERDQNCDDRLKQSLEDIGLSGGSSTLEVLSVKITDDKAVARVKAENRDEEEISNYTLVRSGKGWRISGF